MKVLIVWPKFESFSFWNFEEVCRLVGVKYMTPPLGLLTIAALLPEEWDLRLVDENVKMLDEDDLSWADLVFLGSKIVHRSRALDVIKLVKDRGIPLAVGGADPTISPHIYQDRDIDYLCMGEGEGIIPQLVADIQAGVKSGTYKCEETPDIRHTPPPRFDLIDHRDYLYIGIQYSRGCPYNCEFCNVIDLFDHKYRTKTLDQVLTEMQLLYDTGYRGQLDFFDDNLAGKLNQIKPVLRGIADWLKEHGYPFSLSTSVTLNIAKDDELLELLHEARFNKFLIGIETPDEDALKAAQKQQNTGFSIAEACDRIYRKTGATIHSGFLLGMDGEADTIGDDIIKCIDETSVPWVMAGVVYPLPGTQLAKRLDREGRLFPQVRNDMPEGARDQISAGIQFKPERPALAVLDDLIKVMHHSFDPAKYFDRCKGVSTRLNTVAQLYFGTPLFFRNIRTFLRLCWKMMWMKGARIPFLRGLFAVLFKNNAGLEAYVTLAVLYVHFNGMLDYCYDQLGQQRDELVGLGEAGWLNKHLGEVAARGKPDADSAPLVDLRVPSPNSA